MSQIPDQYASSTFITNQARARRNPSQAPISQKVTLPKLITTLMQGVFVMEEEEEEVMVAVLCFEGTRLSGKNTASHLVQASSGITAHLQHVPNQLFKEYDSKATKSRKAELAAPSGPLHFRFSTEPCRTLPGSAGACSTP